MQRLDGSDRTQPKEGAKNALFCFAIVLVVISGTLLVISGVEDCFPCEGCQQGTCLFVQTPLESADNLCFEEVYFNGKRIPKYDSVVNTTDSCSLIEVPCFIKNEKYLYRNATYDDRSYFKQCPGQAYFSVIAMPLGGLIIFLEILHSGEAVGCQH